MLLTGMRKSLTLWGVVCGCEWKVRRLLMKVETRLLTTIYEGRVKLANDVTYKRLVSTSIRRTRGLCLRANLQDESDHGEAKETGRETTLPWSGFCLGRIRLHSSRLTRNKPRAVADPSYSKIRLSMIRRKRLFGLRSLCGKLPSYMDPQE